MAIQTATNPKTGERIALINGSWVPFTQSATNDQGQKAFLVGGKWVTEGPAAPPKPEEGGFFSNVSNLLVEGGKSALSAAEISPSVISGGVDKGQAETIAKELGRKRVEPKALKEAQAAFADEAADYEKAKGLGVLGPIASMIGEFGKQVLTNPEGAVYLTASSAANMVPSIAGMLGGAKVGGMAGTAVAPGLGTAVGTIGGGIAGGFAGSAPLEIGMEFTSLVGQELQRRGLPPTEANVAAVLEDKKFVEQAVGSARTKGATTAAIDAAFTLGAGRFASAPGRSALKNAAAELGEAASPAQIAALADELLKARTLAQKAGSGAGAVGIDVAGGGLSEAGGQLAAYGEVDLADVGLEMLGELGGSAVEVPAAVRALREPRPDVAPAAPVTPDVEPADVTPADADVEPADEEPKPKAETTTPPTGRFSDADLIATGVEIPPASLPLIRRLTVGKTREELQDFIAENPEYFEEDSATSRVIRSLVAEPVAQPDQAVVAPPAPGVGAIGAPRQTEVSTPAPVAGPSPIPAQAPIPAVTETPSGTTPPKAVEAETQRPEAADPTVPVIEDIETPVAPSDSWNTMDQQVRTQVAQAAGLKKPENFASKKWGSLPKDARTKLTEAIATQEASAAPPAGQGRVPSIEEVETTRQIEGLEKERRKIERNSGSLIGTLRRIGVDSGDLVEVYGRTIPIYAQNLRPKGRQGMPISTMVSDGALDAWLPYDQRLGAPNFDPQEAEQIIKDRMTQQRYLTVDTEIALRQLGFAIEDLERALKLEDINAELEIAAQEQRDLDQEAEADAARAEDRATGRAEEAQAGPDLELTSPSPETFQAEEERAKQAAAEEARAAEEAEKAKAEADKERERKEIEQRSAGAADDFQLGQSAEENLTGQKDIFAQPPEPQISPEKEKEQALKLFSARLSLTTAPFKAKSANRITRLSPKPLTGAQQSLLEELASEAIDLGLPASILSLVTDAGSTGMSGVAAMTGDGALLLSKSWASSSKPEKLFALIHELAHAADFQIGQSRSSGKKFSEEAKWSTAHDELKGWYDKNPFMNPLSYPFAPQFAGKVRLKMESFAQAVALYFTAPVRLQNNAPQAYSEIQSILERIQNESKATSTTGAAKAGTAGVQVQPSRAEKSSAVQPASGKVGTGVGKAARGKDRAAEQVTGDTIEVDGKERPTRNADGRLIESTPEKLRNFWRFFGDSLVVDKKGRPLVVYHGTNTTFEEFAAQDFPGWFSVDPELSARYLREPSDFSEPNIMPVYVSIKNPLMISVDMNDSRQDALDELKRLGFDTSVGYGRGQFAYNVLANSNLQEQLFEMGYDGIMVKEDGVQTMAPILSNQIKSATGNIDGTYSDAQEINMMQSPVQDPDALKGEGKKAVENSRESILYQPIDGTWNTPMDPKPLKLSDEFFYNWVDKQVDLKRVVDAIGATGKRIAGKFNALERERTYHGRVAKRTQDYLTGELQPTIELMQKYGITQREIGEYLLNRHAPEANRVIAERNPRFPDAGSSVKTADAIKYMNSLDPKRKLQLDTVAKRMDKTLTKMQDMLVKRGVESQDTIDGWRDMFQYYIPLVRDDADYSINKVMSQGAGYSRSGDSAKSRTGSSKEVNLDEIFSNIAMQHERMIVRAEGNRVGQAVFGLALQNPNPGFWLALDPETNVIWKTIKELEDIKADRDLLKEMLDSGELSPSQEVQYRMELDLIRKIIRKKEQPARSAFAKARDDLVEGLKFSKEDATKLVQQLMMPPMKARYNKEKNEVVYEPNAAVNNEFVFATRVNGADKFVLFNANDERANRMVRGLKNMDAENLSEAMNIAAKITRFFAAINTQYNPVFGAYNFLRDVQTAALQISTTDIADKRKEVINGTPAALKAIFQVARARRDGKKAKGELAKDFEEFENEGGQTGFRDQFSQSAERAEAIQRMIDPSSWASSPLGNFFTAGGNLKVPFETMRKGAAPLFNFLSDYNQALENSVRLSAYRVARDKFISEGMSPADARQKAAVTAKDITVNFNQKGVKATQMGALFAFFNASIQGTVMMARTLAGPLGRKIIAGGMLWGVIQTIMLSMAGFDDEEPPEFVKQRNFIIPYGDGKYFAFPMPLGFNVIPTLSRLATEAVISGGENTSGKALSALDAVMDMFNPIGNAGLSMQTLAPTLLDPLVALFENKSWTGQSIAREDFSALNPTPGFTRSRDSANAVSQELARFLNAISGGTEDRKGLISPTADQLEYLVGQLTGGVGREALKAGKTIEAAITGEELPSYSVPLVGRFHGNVNEMAAVSSAFYRNLTELNIQKDEIKTIRDNKGDVQAYLAENPEARLVKMATAQYNQIKKLRKLRQEALERGDKERAKKLEEAIKTRMINLNERVAKLEK